MRKLQHAALYHFPRHLSRASAGGIPCRQWGHRGEFEVTPTIEYKISVKHIHTHAHTVAGRETEKRLKVTSREGEKRLKVTSKETERRL